MEDREFLRKHYEKHYGKPVFFVSELIYCSYFKTNVPDYIVNEKMEEGIQAHRYIQNFFMRKYGDKVEVEKTLIMDRGRYILVGHADIVSHHHKLIIEIKPHLGRDVRHIYQLSAYVAMYNQLYNAHYYGAFMVYKLRKDNRGAITGITWNMVKPFYLVMHILSLLDKVAEARIRYGDKTRIGTITCNDCLLKDVCKPHVIYKHNNGYVEVETNA